MCAFEENISSRRTSTGVYVDLDLDGRKKSVNKSKMDLDTIQRNDAKSRIGAIYRRRSAVSDGEFVVPDLCGRGDPRVFAEIARRVSLVQDGRLLDHDLIAIADAQSSRTSKQRTPLGRTVSQPLRKSRSAYFGLCRMLGVSRRTE